jgi:hypothetical protein
MENAVVLIGPQKWGADHASFAQTHGSSSLQDSAQVSHDVRERLERIASMSPRAYVYIYVPKRYKYGNKKGSGKVEFCCEILDIKPSPVRISSPWPTVNGPMDYDMHQDFKYEFWFQVKSVSPCRLDISAIDIVLADGTVKTYQTIRSFTGAWRYKIAFAVKR